MRTNQFKPVKRCSECDKPLAERNKSLLCEHHYHQKQQEDRKKSGVLNLGTGSSGE